MNYFLDKRPLGTPPVLHPNRAEWDPTKFATIPSSESLCERVKFVLRKLRRETWLPPELKQQIETDCGRILEKEIRGRLSDSVARKLVENLATATYKHDHLTLQSSTLCQIRTLDLEMNDRLAQPNFSSLTV